MNEMNLGYLLFFIRESLTRVKEDRDQCSQLIFEFITILPPSVFKLRAIQTILIFSIILLVGCRQVFPVVIFKLNEKQQAQNFQ